MSIFLSILALILFAFVAIIDTIYLLVARTKKVKWYKYVNNTAFQKAFNIDVFGNYQYADLWNFLFTNKHSYKFGRFGETMSSVFGKNIKHGALNPFGYIISWTIDLIDFSKWKNGAKGNGFHCVASIQTDLEIKNFIK